MTRWEGVTVTIRGWAGAKDPLLRKRGYRTPKAAVRQNYLYVTADTEEQTALEAE